MTPKQALAKWNAANPTNAIKFSEGRGRLSREAVAKCTELVASGDYQIQGYVANTTTATDKAQPVVQKIVQTNEKIVREFTILYDERAYVAVDADGKPWSMRNACNNCRVSLVQCHCGKPSIFGDIGVTIVAK
jgi:hypothetical protein